MKATVLVDNNAQNDLACEWGLSVLIETDDLTLLLDAGDSGIFADNAADIGIDLASVDIAVLSHAHYDHADGFMRFFEENSTASLVIQEDVGENCYSDALGELKYAGLNPRILADHTTRIRRVHGVTEIAPGAWTVGHTAATMNLVADDPHMFVQVEGELVPDRFMHEQSLVVKAGKGLVVFNSCSHSGVEAIVAEVRNAWPDEPIYAIVGGLHLFTRTEDEVRAVANTIKELGIHRVYTGHCTGNEAMAILIEMLGDTIVQLHSGLMFEA